MSVNAIQKSEELKEDCELWIVWQILLRVISPFEYSHNNGDRLEKNNYAIARSNRKYICFTELKSK